MEEERHGGHGNDETGVSARALEVANDDVAFRWRGVNWHEVVVVEIYTPGANFAKHRRDLNRGNGRTDKPSAMTLVNIVGRTFLLPNKTQA